MNDKHLQAFKEGKVKLVKEDHYTLGFIIDTENATDVENQVKSVVERYYRFKVKYIERDYNRLYTMRGDNNAVNVRVELQGITSPFTQPIVETETLLTIDTGTSVLYLDIVRGRGGIDDEYQVYRDEFLQKGFVRYVDALEYLIERLPNTDLVVKQNNIS